MGLLVSIIVGGVIGWIASLIMKTDHQIGILGNILIGIVGSGLGHMLAGMIGLAAFGWPARTLVSIIGAVILIWLLRLTGVLM
jgi:Predicted membrane protein